MQYQVSLARLSYFLFYRTGRVWRNSHRRSVIAQSALLRLAMQTAICHTKFGPPHKIGPPPRTIFVRQIRSPSDEYGPPKCAWLYQCKLNTVISEVDKIMRPFWWKISAVEYLQKSTYPGKLRIEPLAIYLDKVLESFTSTQTSRHSYINIYCKCKKMIISSVQLAGPWFHTICGSHW